MTSSWKYSMLCLLLEPRRLLALAKLSSTMLIVDDIIFYWGCFPRSSSERRPEVVYAECVRYIHLKPQHDCWRWNSSTILFTSFIPDRVEITQPKISKGLEQRFNSWRFLPIVLKMKFIYNAVYIGHTASYKMKFIYNSVYIVHTASCLQIEITQPKTLKGLKQRFNS